MERLDFFLEMLKPGEGHWASRSVGAEGSILVENSNVRLMLEEYKSGGVSYAQLLDWANLLRFNDAFELRSDAVLECLDRIEESDELGFELTDRDIDTLIDSLSE